MFKKMIFVAAFVGMGAGAFAAPMSFPQSTIPDHDEPSLRLAQNYSCSPRRYCSRSIGTCSEAYWYYENCSWGGRLDGDNDGVPCENLCSGG